jgi:hypothetical protein
VCEKSLEEHYQITTIRNLLDAVEELDITDKKKTVKVYINVNKRDKYLEDEATAFNVLFRSLSNNN